MSILRLRVEESLCFTVLPAKLQVHSGVEGQGAAFSLNLGQCSSLDEQSHNHGIIILLFHGAIIKRNGKCLWKTFDDERRLKLALNTKEQK